jgi:hypothetical protein
MDIRIAGGQGAPAQRRDGAVHGTCAAWTHAAHATHQWRARGLAKSDVCVGPSTTTEGRARDGWVCSPLSPTAGWVQYDVEHVNVSRGWLKGALGGEESCTSGFRLYARGAAAVGQPPVLTAMRTRSGGYQFSVHPGVDQSHCATLR